MEPIAYTASMRQVLAALVEHEELFYRQLADISGVALSSVHGILVKLESRGWATSRMEFPSPPRGRGRPKRFHRLTPEGRDGAQRLLGTA